MGQDPSGKVKILLASVTQGLGLVCAKALFGRGQEGGEEGQILYQIEKE